MDPDFVVLLVIGGLALAGRMSRGASAAGHSVRAGAGAVVTPIRSGLLHIPVVGRPAGMIVGALGVVAGESVGEVLDGVAAAATWLTHGTPNEDSESTQPPAPGSDKRPSR